MQIIKLAIKNILLDKMRAWVMGHVLEIFNVRISWPSNQCVLLSVFFFQGQAMSTGHKEIGFTGLACPEGKGLFASGTW